MYHEELSSQEISHVINQNSQTVKTQLSKNFKVNIIEYKFNMVENC